MIGSGCRIVMENMSLREKEHWCEERRGEDRNDSLNIQISYFTHLK